MSEIIESILKQRYYLDGESSWEDVCRRVANFIGDTEQEKEDFYEMMTKKEFIPNSPCLFNAGTPDPLMSACFALGVDDSMTSIYSALYKSAILFKLGAGVGFNFSRIRPVGARVGSTNGVASGVLSFMRVFNESIGVIHQGGRRRGASIAILNCSHPEIEDFIKSKTIDGKLTNFNISVLLTDEFLAAVKDNKDWDLKFEDKVYKTVKARDLFQLMYESTYKYGDPGYLFEGNVNENNPNLHLGRIECTNPCVTGDTILITKEGSKRIDTLVDREIEVWNGYEYSLVTPKITGKDQKIVKIVFTDGHRIKCTPYHKFQILKNDTIETIEAKDLKKGDILPPYFGTTYDRTKRENIKIKYIEQIEEIEPLVYCLNEPKNHTFVANGILVGNCGEIPILTDHKTGGGESCNLGSIDVSKFVTPEGPDHFDFDKLHDAICKATRFLNHVIYKNKYPFPEIEEMTKNTAKIGLGIMGFADALIKLEIPYDSREARDIAEELMEFINNTAIQESIQIAEESGCYPAWEGSDWEKQGIKIANSTLTCQAPTGTISIFADCSSGIEPIWLVIERRNTVGKNFFVIHPLFEKELKKECSKNDKNFDDVINHAFAHGTVQDVPWLSDKFKRTFKSALDIGWQDHILMQEAFQKHTGNSISKTVNTRENIPVTDVKDMILFAWEHGCKGFTLYRSGSKKEEVLSLKEKEKVVQKEKEPELPTKRPRVLFGATYQAISGCGKIYTTVNYYNGKPYEVLVLSGGNGGCQAQNEAVGRNSSLSLRNGINYLQIVKQLRKVKCPVAIKNPKSEGKSCADIIGGHIAESMGDDLKIASEEIRHAVESPRPEIRSELSICPDCGATLTFGEGCNKGACRVCGWSGCT